MLLRSAVFHLHVIGIQLINPTSKASLDKSTSLTLLALGLMHVFVVKNSILERKKGFLPFGNVNLVMNVSDLIVLVQYCVGSVSV
jgi:hypothetical protein